MYNPNPYEFIWGYDHSESTSLYPTTTTARLQPRLLEVDGILWRMVMQAANGAWKLAPCPNIIWIMYLVLPGG